MCELKASVKKGDIEEVVMDNVAAIKPLEGDKFLLRGLLGESMEIEGRLEEVNLISNRVLFSQTG